MSAARHSKRDEAIARDVLKNGSNLDRRCLSVTAPATLFLLSLAEIKGEQ